MRELRIRVTVVVFDEPTSSVTRRASQHFWETKTDNPTASTVVMTAASNSPSTMSRVSDGMSVITIDRIAVDQANPIAHSVPFKIA